MSVPDPSAVDWVPLGNAAGTTVPLPVTNGQWVKGVGGVPVWAAITPADIAVTTGKFIKGAASVGSSGDVLATDIRGGLAVPIASVWASSGASITGGWNWLSWAPSAGHLFGVNMPSDVVGPGLLYTQCRCLTHFYVNATNGCTDWNYYIGFQAQSGGSGNWQFGPWTSLPLSGGGVRDSGWITAPAATNAFYGFQFLGNAAAGVPTVQIGASIWVRGAP